MKKKKRKTLTPLGILGYLTATWVSPLKRATSVTAMQKPRTARDMRTRPQKKAKVKPSRGGSLEMMGFPLAAREDVLDEVGGVHDAAELHEHADVEREEGEVLVDVVDHAVAREDLGGQLAQDAGEDDHAQANVQEHELDAVGHAEHVALRVGGPGGLVDGEHDHEDHELPAHQVAVQVVALEGDGRVLVGDGVAVLVEVRVHGGKADEGGLLALDHGKPEHGQDADDQRHPLVGLAGDLRVTGEDEGADEDDGEDEEADGEGVPDQDEGRQLDVMGLGTAGFGDIVVSHDVVLFWLRGMVEMW